ncbi:response regulator transcription factor [Piscinibacter gummiphilus]|uniref:DNA-binding response regulator n=1 Tax=Piscinibacter gummiphilus TaxID=946333 RepID=A0A1W6LE75_9BURK|nr:response regulator transcription factor [Piscinibacter gummiphilus]ARN22564.1 DNA-binding response regulator [Piscinibacter gummiphilus]ATU67262.1 DNA-binding response regulator [Piscinibacter gummiphilus]GLS97600.1 DNA-binding response regulator [Piscinibacter gummiphilus]
MTGKLPDRSTSDLVLVVDDMPDNLSVLHDALDEAGYTVLVATNGEQALQRAAQALPDIVLLDAMMPGMDGFEVARRLKAHSETAHIPVIFMTGLTETEHVVAAYGAGGVDYVTKPIRPMEVLARMTVHLQSARQARQARNALDAFGHATMAIHADDALTVGKAVWQTPLARDLMLRYFEAPVGQVPPEVLEWLRSQTAGEPRPLTVAHDERQLVLSLQQRTADDDWLVVMREVSDAAVVQSLQQTFKLTMKEAEVLYWVAKGKTNRDIGDILGSSPATVKKHLEHVFEKLGVETRNAAASLAISKVRLLA